MLTLPKPLYKVEFVEVRRAHYYDTEGPHGVVRYPGVTGKLGIIAKPQLIGWAAKMAANYYAERVKERMALLAKAGKKDKAKYEITPAWLDELAAEAKMAHRRKVEAAADIGTRIHAKVDEFVKTGKIPVLLEDEKPGFENFLGWMQKSGIRIIAGDTPVASHKLGVGGKLDALGDRNGSYVVLDWKTGSGLYAEHALQSGGAYAHMAEETYGINVEGAIVVRFGKTDAMDFEAKEVKNLTMSLEAFETASKLKDLMEEEYFLPNKAVVPENMEQVA